MTEAEAQALAAEISRTQPVQGEPRVWGPGPQGEYAVYFEMTGGPLGVCVTHPDGIQRAIQQAKQWEAELDHYERISHP